MVRTDQSASEFLRLHKAFILHFGAATVLAWLTSLYASFHAPWVRNLAFLIDPSSYKVESTWTYLFGFPLLMTVAWVAVLLARDMLFATRLRGHLIAEFAVAGAVGFLMFYLAVDRAVAALRLAF
jgi:hypothetical protein